MYDFSAFCQLHPELKSCQILPSELGEQIGDYGAIAAFTMS